MPVTISAAQREALYTQVLDHLSGIGDLWLAIESREYEKAGTLGHARPWPSHQTHFHRFDSWRKALLSAGLAANPSSAIAGHRIFDKGQCIDALRHVRRELGNVPTLNQYEGIARESNGALPSGATIRNRCRSWGEALRLAGIA
jgi:hypothetical protein